MQRLAAGPTAAAVVDMLVVADMKAADGINL
jgi:hypothetical protein